MTNQLFQDVLDGRIPMPRKRIRTVFYFLPNLADPTAPTMAELNAGIDLSTVVTLNLPPQVGLTTAIREDEQAAKNAALGEMAAATGLDVDALASALNALDRAARDCRCCIQAIDKPAPPKPWAGNIATQKRRRRL